MFNKRSHMTPKCGHLRFITVQTYGHIESIFSVSYKNKFVVNDDVIYASVLDYIIGKNRSKSLKDSAYRIINK